MAAAAGGCGPVCLRCFRLLKPVHVGAYLEEQTELGKPYKLWACDIWGCPECGMEIVYGTGDQPLAHASDGPDYEQTKANVSRIRLVYGK